MAARYHDSLVSQGHGQGVKGSRGQGVKGSRSGVKVRGQGQGVLVKGCLRMTEANHTM